MVYKNVIRIFDERRGKLANLLTDSTVQLKPERQHQIRGAIDEIDLLLLTLRQQQDMRVQKTFHNSVQIPESEGVIRRFGNVFRTRKQTSRNFVMNEKK